MKQIVIASYGRMSLYILFFAFLLHFSTGCKKDDSSIPDNNVISSNSSDATNASSYSADVIDKWMTMQIRLERDAVGIPNVAFVRYYAYSGIAALESVSPGMPKNQTLTNKWNGLTGLPQAGPPKNYYWPASVNTAMAAMNRDILRLQVG